MGRIEHKLLDGDKLPNRPKTNGRNTILAHKSNDRNILPQKKRAGKLGARPEMAGAEGIKTVTPKRLSAPCYVSTSYTPANFGSKRDKPSETGGVGNEGSHTLLKLRPPPASAS
jgi:hypothetical protein